VSRGILTFNGEQPLLLVRSSAVVMLPLRLSEVLNTPFFFIARKTRRFRPRQRWSG
jgi:hypothetical protein